MMRFLVRLRQRLWPMPLALVLAGTFGVLMVVSVGLVLSLSVMAGFKSTFSLLNEQSVLMVQALQDGLKSRLDPAKHAVSDLKRLYETEAIDFSDDVAVEQVLTGALAASEAVDAWILYDTDFVQRGAARQEDGSIMPVKQAQESLAQVRDLLREISATDDVTWSPLVSTEFGIYTAAVAPLARNGDIEYYLVGAISVGFLSSMVEEIATDLSATAYIIEWPLNLVAHSRSNEIGLSDEQEKGQPSVPLVIAGDPVLQLLPFSEERETFEEASEQGVQVRAIEAAGVPYVAIFGTIAGFGPNPWITGVYFPRSEVGQSVERLIGSAIAGVGALIVSLILVVLLGRRVAAPITNAADRFNRIAALDIETISTASGSPIRELNDGARAFNAMVTGLRAFTAYVPRSLARKLIHLGLEDAGRSREAELTVLFTDIVGFTRLSETMPAAETARVLNRHFEILVACIEAEDGTVDKYLGDGLLAFWNAPNEKDDHPAAAIRAAEAIRNAIRHDNLRAESEQRPAIRLRIGIHTGPVIVGNIGALDRVDYTIVGDTVNVSQRLQALGKKAAPTADIAILLSGATRDRLPDDCSAADLGEHFVEGREAGITVWQLADDSNTIPAAVPDRGVLAVAGGGTR